MATIDVQAIFSLNASSLANVGAQALNYFKSKAIALNFAAPSLDKTFKGETRKLTLELRNGTNIKQARQAIDEMFTPEILTNPGAKKAVATMRGMLTKLENKRSNIYLENGLKIKGVSSKDAEAYNAHQREVMTRFGVMMDRALKLYVEPYQKAKLAEEKRIAKEKADEEKEVNKWIVQEEKREAKEKIAADRAVEKERQQVLKRNQRVQEANYKETFSSAEEKNAYDALFTGDKNRKESFNKLISGLSNSSELKAKLLQKEASDLYGQFASGTVDKNAVSKYNELQKKINAYNKQVSDLTPKYDSLFTGDRNRKVSFLDLISGLSGFSGEQATSLKKEASDLYGLFKSGNFDRSALTKYDELKKRIAEYNKSSSAIMLQYNASYGGRRGEIQLLRQQSSLSQYGSLAYSVMDTFDDLSRKAQTLGNDPEKVKQWMSNVNDAIEEGQIVALKALEAERKDSVNMALSGAARNYVLTVRQALFTRNAGKINELTSAVVNDRDASQYLRNKNISSLNAYVLSQQYNPFSMGQRTFGAMGQDLSKALINSFGIVGLTSALSTLASYSKQLDKSVVDIQIATGTTRKQAQDLVLSYSDIGLQYGATTTDVAKAADDWLRQGNSIAETNELVVDSLMLSKLGQMDAASATQSLTAVMKGYNIEAADASSIVDKLVTVDMQAAVSAGDIAKALSHTSVTARTTGVDLNTLIGYLTTIQEVTQASADEVGNSMKSMLSRMGLIKTGKLVDTETQEDISNVEIVLKDLGIQLRTTGSDWRDFQDVLGDVANSWDTYSDTEKRSIATAFSGVRNQEKFLVLMENYSSAIDYANTSMNSSGNASKKYEAYLDGIESKMSSLTSVYEKFSTTLFDSNLAGSSLDLFTKALSRVTSFLSLTSGGSIFGTVGALASKSAIGRLFANGLYSGSTAESVNQELQRYAMGTRDFSQLSDRAQGFARNVTVGDEKSLRIAQATVSGGTFGGTLKGIGKSLWVTAVIAGAGAVIGSFVESVLKSFTAQKDAVTNATSELSATEQSLSDLRSSLDSNKLQLEEYNSKSNLTSKEEEAKNNLEALIKSQEVEIQNTEQQRNQLMQVAETTALLFLSTSKGLQVTGFNSEVAQSYYEEYVDALSAAASEPYYEGSAAQKRITAALNSINEYTQSWKEYLDEYGSSYEALYSANNESILKRQQYKSALDAMDNLAIMVSSAYSKAEKDYTLIAEKYSEYSYGLSPFTTRDPGLLDTISAGGRPVLNGWQNGFLGILDTGNWGTLFNNLYRLGKSVLTDEKSMFTDTIYGFDNEGNSSPFFTYSHKYGDENYLSGNDLQSIMSLMQDIPRLAKILPYLSNDANDWLIASQYGSAEDYLINKISAKSGIEESILSDYFKNDEKIKELLSTEVYNGLSDLLSNVFDMDFSDMETLQKNVMSKLSTSSSTTLKHRSMSAYSDAFSILSSTISNQQSNGFLQKADYDNLITKFNYLGIGADEVFGSLLMFDGKLRLNSEKLIDLANAEIKSTVSTKKQALASDLINLAYYDNIAATSSLTEELQTARNQLRKSIVTNLSDILTLESYGTEMAKWLINRSSGNSGAVYTSNIAGTMKLDIDNALKTGRTGKGNVEYNAAMDYIFGDNPGFNTSDPKAVKKAMSGVNKYLKNDKSSISYFESQMKKAGYTITKDKDGNKTFGGAPLDISTIAGVMGVGEDFARNFMMNANEFLGYDFKFQDSYLDSINEKFQKQLDLKDKIAAAEEKVQSYQSNTGEKTQEQIDAENELATLQAEYKDNSISAVEAMYASKTMSTEDAEKYKALIEEATSNVEEQNIDVNFVPNTLQVLSAIEGLPTEHNVVVNFVTGNIDLPEQLPGSISVAGGTTDAYGSAFADGNYTPSSGGKALVGELGPELVVDPNNSSWKTVGNTGAEIVDLPKNAIVFNHEQTKSILKNKKIGSRGKAYAKGTSSTTKKNKYLSSKYSWVDYENMFAEQTDAWFNRQEGNISDAESRISEMRAKYESWVKKGSKLSNENFQKLNKALAAADKKLYDMKKKLWEEQNKRDKETLTHLKSQSEQILNIKESHYDLTTSIRQERQELQKEYELARDAMPYLTEAEREAAFSEQDYISMMNALDDIEARGNLLTAEYNEKIKNISEDESYLLSNITEEYKNQLDIINKEYAVQKQKLSVEKAQKALENALNNRSVAMLVNGKWTWSWDYETVKSAMSDLSDAQNALANAQDDLTLQTEITDLKSYINSIEDQVSAIDNMVFSLDSLATEVHDLTDNLRKALPKYASGGVNVTTGAAILHGTSANPEVVFNSAAASKLYNFVESTPDISAYIADSIINQLNSNVGGIVSNNTPASTYAPVTDNRVFIDNISVPEQYADQFLSLLRSMMALY